MKLCYYTKWAVYFLTKQSYSSFTLNRETVWKVNPPMEKIKLIIDGFCQYFCQLWKRISDVHLVVLFSPEILKEAKTFLKLYLNNWIRFFYLISAMVRTKFKGLFTEDIILPLFSLILVSLKTGFWTFSSMYQSAKKQLYGSTTNFDILIQWFLIGMDKELISVHKMIIFRLRWQARISIPIQWPPSAKPDFHGLNLVSFWYSDTTSFVF